MIIILIPVMRRHEENLICFGRRNFSDWTCFRWSSRGLVSRQVTQTKWQQLNFVCVSGFFFFFFFFPWSAVITHKSWHHQDQILKHLQNLLVSHKAKHPVLFPPDGREKKSGPLIKLVSSFERQRIFSLPLVVTQQLGLGEKLLHYFDIIKRSQCEGGQRSFPQ